MSSLNLMLFGTGSNVVVTAGVARGVFSRHGLALDIKYTQGSEMLCETLRTGGCDIGVLAADDVVYEVERRGLDFFLFMGIHAGLLSLMVRPEIGSLADLAGRRFGVDDTASGFVLLARHILRDQGLAEGAYTLVKAKGMNLRADAWRVATSMPRCCLRPSRCNCKTAASVSSPACTISSLDIRRAAGEQLG